MPPPVLMVRRCVHNKAVGKFGTGYACSDDIASLYGPVCPQQNMYIARVEYTVAAEDGLMKPSWYAVVLFVSVALLLEYTGTLFAGVVMAETSAAKGPNGETNSQLK